MNKVPLQPVPPSPCALADSMLEMKGGGILGATAQPGLPTATFAEVIRNEGQALSLGLSYAPKHSPTVGP